MRCISVVILGLFCLIAEPPSSGYASEAPPSGADRPVLDLRDGDRVALIGDTFIEREQRSGYVETALTIANPNKNLTFRNLGWSGDTVAGLSRAGFDPPEAGFKQLIDQVFAVKPTVIIIGYGGNESFEGQAGVDTFSKGLVRLIDALRPTQARFVLLPPLKQEKLGAPLPDPTKHNKDVALFTDTVEKLAKKTGSMFLKIDPFAGREMSPGQSPLTDNGVHLTDLGYWSLAKNLPAVANRPQTVSSSADGVLGSTETVRFSIDIADRSPWSTLTIDMKPEVIRFKYSGGNLPLPPRPGTSFPTVEAAWGSPVLTVTGLPVGRYLLSIDGKPAGSTTDQELSRGIVWVNEAEIARSEKLRETIVKKNELFFHRWRPQNITYLFGFRKHEQGNNAVEIPKFDPLVAEQEQKIAELKKPASHVYELVREEEVKGAAQ